MKAENTLIKITKAQLEFKTLKKLFVRSDIPDESCYLAFKETINLFSNNDDKLSSVDLKNEMFEILLLLHEKHESIYNRVVNDFSSIIIKVIISS